MMSSRHVFRTYPRNSAVCVLSMGQVGLATAKHVKERGLMVFGYVIHKESVDKAKHIGIFVEREWERVPKGDVYITCVSAWPVDGLPDLTPVFDVSKKMSFRTNKENLVSIEGTVVPGTLDSPRSLNSS